MESDGSGLCSVLLQGSENQLQEVVALAPQEFLSLECQSDQIGAEGPSTMYIITVPTHKESQGN